MDTFIESQLQHDLHVDREHNIVHDVKIVGPVSRNVGDRANDYPASSLARAIPLYEGMTVYSAHSKDEKGNWQYSDANGNVRNVHPAPDGSLFGDHHYNPKHHLTEQYLWDAEHNPGNVAFSHEAAGRRRYNSQTKRYIVEEIKQVNGICMVPRGGTSSSLFEQQHKEDTNMADLAEQLAALTIEQLRSSRPDMVAAISGTEELKNLREQVVAFQAEKAAIAKQSAISVELATAKLTEADLGPAVSKLLLSPVLIEQLNAAPDAPARAKLIEYVKSLTPTPTPTPTSKTWAQAVATPATPTQLTTFTEAKTVEQTISALRA